MANFKWILHRYPYLSQLNYLTIKYQTEKMTAETQHDFCTCECDAT